MHPIMKRFLLSFGLTVLTLLTYTQSYYFDVYGVKDGLGQSDVYTLQQSDDGVLWLGTAAGLSKFNGNKFENFTTNDGMASNGIKSMFIDTNNSIWTGHISGGISLKTNGKIKKINLNDSLLDSDISSIVMSKDGKLWISSVGDGAYEINNPYNYNETPVNNHYKGEQGLSDRVFKIFKSEKHGLLFVTDVGVKYYNSKKDTFFSMLDIYEHWPTFFSQTCVFEDSKRNIWVGTYNGGLYKFNDTQNKPKVFDIRDGLAYNWISTISEDEKGNIWVGTWGGGISKITNDKLITFNNSNGLPDNKIRAIKEDYEGNILIGTKNHGLAIFKGRAFKHYRNFIEGEIIHINNIEKDNSGNFWLASNSGIFITDENFNIISHLTKENENSLKSNDIRYLDSDDNGNMWIGTWGGGVSFYNIEKGKMVFPFSLNNVIYQAGMGNVTAMLTRNNKVYIGTYDGLIYFDQNSNVFQRLSQSNSLAGNDISALYLDKENNIWVGSRGKGISLLKGMNIERVLDTLLFTPTSFYQDSKKTIWVGTEGLGVIKINNNKFSNEITTENGLFTNLISSIIGDDEDNIYIGTNNGINYIENDKDKVFSFSKKEGFSSIEAKQNAVLSNSDKIIFGTINGLTVINSKLLKVNKTPPKTTITSLKVNLKDRKLEQNLELKHTENSILFNYQSICLTNPEKIKYKVMLEGADQSWQPVTSRTFANYPALSHGEYTFKVLASNNEGIWNTNPTTYTFTIKPPFWKTWWFYSIIAVFFISGVIAFIRIREARLVKEKEILEKRVQQRTEVIRMKNKELNIKNKNITDSINYAKRIQKAMMPDIKKIKQIAKSTFVFYKPKDIVSGDFFWHTLKNEWKIVVAADCTGHGVPGAFMSMISISALNTIVNEKSIIDPGEILNNLRSQIINDLKQSSGDPESQTKDGLDIALLAVNEKEKKIKYAGAYNSLYIIKNKHETYKDLLDIKADRMPIGLSAKMDKTFTTHTFNIEEGDCFYITSDGYIDQFGGPKGKKFMSKRFKKLIFKLDKENSSNALETLDKEFNNWKGKEEQLDDVLVIGLRY